MKQTLCFLLFSILLASCSSSDDNQQDDFFNLNTGNMRVYKRYNTADGVNFIPTSRIDSVFTTGDTIIGGNSYEKFVHKIYTSGEFHISFTEAFRVDENGHLVSPSGFVVHPGYDAGYTGIRAYFINPDDVQLGNIYYHLDSPMNVTVENQDFYVYPYVGNYIPFNPEQQEQIVYDQYQAGLGLVTQHCDALMGDGGYQDRLVYYEVD